MTVNLHFNVDYIPIRRSVRQGDTSHKVFITALECIMYICIKKTEMRRERHKHRWTIAYSA